MKIQAFLFMAALAPSGLLRADLPEIEPGVMVSNVYGNGIATPTSTDWDNDGRKDLIVGQEMNGYILLYLNVGTDLNPLFNSGVKIESSGVPISTTYT